MKAEDQPFVDKGFHIDAEDLAEDNGRDPKSHHMVLCYQDAAVKMREIGVMPIDISDMDLEDHVRWTWATFIYFSFVNSQLEGTEYRFYAMGSGNDLMGIFLTQAQLKERLSAAENWWQKPYLPTMLPPTYGAPK